MKFFVFTILLFFTHTLTADWSLSKFFMNKIPLKVEIRNDINQYFNSQIQSLKVGLVCFPKAKHKQQALNCAKAVDTKMANLMKSPESETEMMQEKVNKIAWNGQQKSLLIKEIQQNIQEQQKSMKCISKALTMGDLDHCFKNKPQP